MPGHHRGSHSHEWEIDPSLYESLRTVGYKDMRDLVDTVEEIAEDWRQCDGNRDE